MFDHVFMIVPALPPRLSVKLTGQGVPLFARSLPPRLKSTTTEPTTARLAQDSRMNYQNDEYLRKRRLNTSRWALAIGGYGTITWAYGDRLVEAAIAALQVG